MIKIFRSEQNDLEIDKLLYHLEEHPTEPNEAEEKDNQE
jgi:hypothetical protein